MSPSWAERLRAGLKWGVPPEAFWRLSLAEWRALADAGAPPALGREQLLSLMEQHPDEGGG